MVKSLHQQQEITHQQKPAMWAMLRGCGFVSCSIQAVQTWWNVETSMLIATQKRQPLFFEHSWNTNKQKVAKLHVFWAPKTCHVGHVARLPFRQFFDSSRTNLIECQRKHVDCNAEERTAFLWVFVKYEQKKSCKIACFWGAKNLPCGRCCATAVSSILRFKPYKLDRMSTEACWL